MAWVKGQSGNPSGRPKGDGRLRDRLHEAAPELMDQLIARARNGDPVAVKVFWERVLPALKAEAARVELNVPPGTLLERGEAVLALAAAGELPLDAATEYINNVVKLVAIEAGTVLKDQLALLLADKFGDIA